MNIPKYLFSLNRLVKHTEINGIWEGSNDATLGRGRSCLLNGAATQQCSATGVRSTPKALSATSMLVTMPVTQQTALPLRGDITLHLLRWKGWYHGSCPGAMGVWKLGIQQHLAHVFLCPWQRNCFGPYFMGLVAMSPSKNQGLFCLGQPTPFCYDVTSHAKRT